MNVRKELPNSLITVQIQTLYREFIYKSLDKYSMVLDVKWIF